MLLLLLLLFFPFSLVLYILSRWKNRCFIPYSSHCLPFLWARILVTFSFLARVRAKVLQSCPILWPYGLQPARLLCPRVSRQEYWSGLLCPPPGDLLDSGIEPGSLLSPALLSEFFTVVEAQGQKNRTEQNKTRRALECRNGKNQSLIVLTPHPRTPVVTINDFSGPPEQHTLSPPPTP